MTKGQYIDLLRELVAEEKHIFNGDKPALRQFFNDTKDSLHKDGDITDIQVNNWILTDGELRMLLNVAKG